MKRKKTNSTQAPQSISTPDKMTSVKSSYHEDLPRRQDPAVVEDECRLLDKLLEGFQIRSDAALAAWLGIDKSAIYGVRSGKHRLGFIHKLKVLDRIGFLKGRSLVESLLPEALAAKLTRISRTLASSQAEAALSRLTSQNPNAQLIDLTKLILGYETDIPLAHLLQIKTNTVSMIRSGRSALGPEAKLRLLGSVDRMIDAESILRVAKSNDLLSNAIDRWIRSEKESLPA